MNSQEGYLSVMLCRALCTVDTEKKKKKKSLHLQCDACLLYFVMLLLITFVDCFNVLCHLLPLARQWLLFYLGIEY